VNRWSPGQLARAALTGAILSACAIGVAAGNDSAATLESALAHCTAIAAGEDRLACYDALVNGRSRTVSPTSPAVTPQPSPAVTPQAPPAVTPQAPPAPTKEEFGLSTVQKQKAQPQQKQIESIKASVTGFGRSAIGRVLVGLDNGQSWELDSADPLLGVGDAVVIERGALGSFLLITPSRRTHHVRRIR
jgi:hypothetical protein